MDYIVKCNTFVMMDYFYGLFILISYEAGFLCRAERCAPIRYDIAFYLNRNNQGMGGTNSEVYYTSQRTFAHTIIDKFPVGYMQTRFSAYVYGESYTKFFDFKTMTTKEAVKGAIPKTTPPTRSETKDNIRIIWNSIFRESEGDRLDIPNYCFMFVSLETNLTYQSLGEKPGNIELWMIDAQEYFNSGEYSDDRIDEFANVYKPISYVSSSYIDPYATEFIGKTEFECKSTCGDDNFFAYDYPSQITSSKDNTEGAMTILMDTAWDISCCAVVKQWSFWAKSSGILKIGLLRPNGTNYYFVGFNEIIIPESSVNSEVVYENGDGERIAFKDGDKIAWHSSGKNIIAYKSCTTAERSDCPQNTRQFIPSTEPEVGENFDISTASTLTNRGYSIMLTTAENSAQTLTSGESETSLEWNTELGTSAIYLKNKDPDGFEEFTYTIQQSPVGANGPYFELNIPTLTIDLIQKLPLADSGPYVIIVKSFDTCEHTATVTVTIGTYNAPPIVTNLPHILEVLETTREPMPLFKINVIDATNDEICCTMPYSIPASYNFELKQMNRSDGGVDLWLYVRDNPIFEYSDIDAYRVFVCCQDAYGSSFSYLIVRLIEVKQEVPYVPPDWFYRALIISLTPISLMTAVACIVLLLSVFWF